MLNLKAHCAVEECWEWVCHRT